MKGKVGGAGLKGPTVRIAHIDTNHCLFFSTLLRKLCSVMGEFSSRLEK
jgi:hypothetical protein